MNGFTIFLFTLEGNENNNWDSIILSTQLNKQSDFDLSLNKTTNSFSLALNKQIDFTLEK